MGRYFYLIFAALILIVLVLTNLGGFALADNWERVAQGGIKGDYNQIQNEADCSAVFNGKLYVGTQSGYVGCQIWRYDSGTSWTKVNDNGFGDDRNWTPTSMFIFGTHLYVGTFNFSFGCEVWRYDGSVWTPVVGAEASTANGFGDSKNTMVTSMYQLGSYLYAGTYNNGSAPGCEVWRTSNGTTWAQVVGQGTSGATANGFGDSGNLQASSMRVLGSSLYAATYNTNGCELWSTSNGTTWVPVVGQGSSGPTSPGFGDTSNTDALSMEVLGTYLYAGTRNSGGCEVWRTSNGTTWTQVVGQGSSGSTAPGFGNNDNQLCASFRKLPDTTDYLYAGTANASGCDVWYTDGIGTTPTWTQVVGQGASGPTAPGFGNDTTEMCQTLVVFDGTLYAGSSNHNDTTTGCQVWSLGGATPNQVNWNGFTGNHNVDITAMAQFKDKLFVGTENNQGCRVWSYDGSDWSEVVGQGSSGSTAPGFGDVENTKVESMCVFGTYLYAGTFSSDHYCEIWRTEDGTNWNQVVGQGSPGQNTGHGFGYYSNAGACNMEVFGTYMYVGTDSSGRTVGFDIMRTNNGTDWERVVGGPNPVAPNPGRGFGGLYGNLNLTASSMAVCDGKLYVGTGPTVCQVFSSSDGLHWSQVNTDCFGKPTVNTDAAAMAVYGSPAKLYVGNINTSSIAGAEVWRYDGPGTGDWAQVNVDGFGSGDNRQIHSLFVSGGSLYAGTKNSAVGCQVWKYASGTTWNPANADGFNNNTKNYTASVMEELGGKLYVGTYNDSDGPEVWRNGAAGPPPPEITGVTPSSGYRAETVAISDLAGNNFQTGGTTVVWLLKSYNQIAATDVAVPSSNKITCKFAIPADAETGTWDIWVENPDGQKTYLENGFTVEVPPSPSISSITPNSGFRGTTVSITNLAGTGFRAGAAVKLLKTGEDDIVAVNVAVVSSVKITCKFTIPATAATGPWNVRVENAGGGGAEFWNLFTIKPKPSITSISPTSATTGSYITISGNNFGGTRGSSYVAYGSTKVTSSTSYTSWSSTKIKVKVPSTISRVTSVKVYVEGIASNSKTFKVKPKITSLSPTSGKRGSKLTINGTAFGSSRSTSYVKIGGVKVATYYSWSNTRIVVKVPSATPYGSQAVKVTTSGGTSSGKTFTVKR